MVGGHGEHVQSALASRIRMKTNFEKDLRVAGFLADLSDTKFQVAGFRFGIDPLIGVVPIIGDLLGVVLSLYIYALGHKMRVSSWHKFVMLVNIMIDLIIGSIPMVGDVFDFFYKANQKNYKILASYRKEDVEKKNNP